MQALLTFNLRHPNILGVEAVLYDDRRQEVYVQTHWCHGGDLLAYLKAEREAKRPVDGACPCVAVEFQSNTLTVAVCAVPNLLRQVLNGLAYLHSQHVVHCDI